MIFQDADYVQISIKEVEEITSIFASYEIYIKELELNGEHDHNKGAGEASSALVRAASKNKERWP